MQRALEYDRVSSCSRSLLALIILTAHCLFILLFALPLPQQCSTDGWHLGLSSLPSNQFSYAEERGAGDSGMDYDNP